MKPIFVKEWHGIPLGTIQEINKDKIPRAEFYTVFYEKYFETHQNWKDLQLDWVAHKNNCAKVIKERLDGMKRVLSIGCGIGIIEKYLLESGVKGLEIHEISEEPLFWIRPLFVNEAVHNW